MDERGWTLIGLVLMAVGGFAWMVTSLSLRLWEEAAYCVIIGGGFGLAAVALGRFEAAPAKWFAAGLFFGGLGILLPFVSGGGLFTSGAWSVYAILATGGLWLAAALLVAPGVVARRILVQAALVVSAAGQSVQVYLSDIVGTFNRWTLGNLLVLVGTLVVAWFVQPPTSGTVGGSDGSPA